MFPKQGRATDFEILQDTINTANHSIKLTAVINGPGDRLAGELERHRSRLIALADGQDEGESDPAVNLQRRKRL